jgi:transposase-like protein
VERGYRKPPVLAIEDLGLELGELRGDPVEELARYGARLVLMSCLEAEVTEQLGAGRYERRVSRCGSRNGHRLRKVACGVGGLAVEYPKVRDTEAPFRSAILGAWQRKSRTLLSTLPSLYVEGLSTRDFERALSPLWEEAGISRSTISRANEEIKGAFEAWRGRRLAGEEVVYLFLDGYYEGVRLGVKEKEAILVAHGITRAGRRVLLGVYLGCQEGTESWKLALQDLVGRGLPQPLLVVSDGNPGLIRAVKETWPTVLRQRCTVHRTRNVLGRVPKKDHKRIRQALNRIFYAASLEEALSAAEEFAGRWQNLYPSAVETLGRDLADCLTFFRFPPRHWKRLRTSNSLERCLREVRRRTRVVGRFPTEISALSLVWSVMDQDSNNWRGMVMDAEHVRLLEAAVESFVCQPIVVKGFEELLAA